MSHQHLVSPIGHIYWKPKEQWSLGNVVSSDRQQLQRLNRRMKETRRNSNKYFCKSDACTLNFVSALNHRHTSIFKCRKDQKYKIFYLNFYFKHFRELWYSEKERSGGYNFKKARRHLILNNFLFFICTQHKWNDCNFEDWLFWVQEQCEIRIKTLIWLSIKSLLFNTVQPWANYCPFSASLSGKQNQWWSPNSEDRSEG